MSSTAKTLAFSAVYLAGILAGMPATLRSQSTADKTSVAQAHEASRLAAGARVRLTLRPTAGNSLLAGPFE